MLIKIVIVIVIIFLLRSHLAFLRPYWHVFVGFGVGAVTGWLMVSVLNGLKVNVEHDLGYLGCPAKLIRPLFALVGGLASVNPVSTALRRLFPYREESNGNVR